ncbi:MAG: hypothetical protein NTV00_00535, partial [Methylococcales bacterium]|nr:hypothetical protein [Methylococcales bacterium]
DDNRTLTPSDQAFEDAAQSYIDKFGYFPVGINYPDLTTELLLSAVKSGQEIQPGKIPDGAES